MVNLVRHDLEFILKQIKIAEAHSKGTPLNQIRVDANGNVVTDGSGTLAIPTNLSPYGLRAVNGSYNNLVQGREEWGASDNPFPRITDPYYRTESDDSIVFGAGSPGQVTFTDGNYAEMGNPTPASMGLGGGTLVDADPRIISNLIVDQTVDNPAAIYAALAYDGVTGTAMSAALDQYKAAYQPYKTDAAAAATAKAASNAALAAVTTAQQNYTAISSNPASTPEQIETAFSTLQAALAKSIDAVQASEIADAHNAGNREGRQQRHHPECRTGRRSVGSVQWLVHFVWTVLRSRSRSGAEGRQRNDLHSASAGRSALQSEQPAHQLHGAHPCPCQSGQPDDAVGRSEPDLYVALVPPAVPARLRPRGWKAPCNRKAA
jgi:hypothetical protein